MNEKDIVQCLLNDRVAFEVVSGLNFKPMVERKFVEFKEGDIESYRIM